MVCIICFLVPPVAAQPPSTSINLTVYNVADVPMDVVRDAESEISSMFAAADFDFQWQHREPETPVRRELDNPMESALAHASETCSSGDAYSIVVQFTERFPRQYRPTAIAFSLPFARAGVRVTVFYDRVRTLARNVGLRQDRVLAAMLGHEIGHVLIGTDSHFDTGLMRKTWEIGDLASLNGAMPALSGIETRLMHRRIKLWRNAQQQCTAAPASLEAGGQ
jgi:hypothetical protein